MDRLERRREFHNAIVNRLFPPPSSSENEDEKDHADNKFKEFSHVDVFRDSDTIGDSSGSSSPESEGEGEGEGGDSKMLSRAQRKRLRKKKLREAASSRPRKIIGPMLPTASRDFVPVDCPQGVRQNVFEETNAAVASAAAAAAGLVTSVIDGSDQLGACNNKNRLKQRRKAKRLARERARSSVAKNSGQDCESCDRGTCCAEHVSNEKSTKTTMDK